MATPFTHTSLQTTLARPGQCGSGKTSSPATIGARGPGIERQQKLRNQGPGCVSVSPAI